jgi:hypothetical protein
MPRLAFWVACCAASLGVGLTAGCALDLNGTNSEVAESALADAGTEIFRNSVGDGTAPTANGVGTGRPDANAVSVTADGKVLDPNLRDASVAGEGQPDARLPDAANPATRDGAIDDAGCASGDPSCVVVPAGWSIVALATGRTALCPRGFQSGSADVVEGPNAANACTCGACSVTNNPCDQGEVGASYGSSFGGNGGGGPTCSSTVKNFPIDPGGSCQPYQAPTGMGMHSFNAVSFRPPASTGGTCVSPGLADSTQVSVAAEERMCLADSAQAAACGAGQPCDVTVDAPYGVCLMAGGSVACPAGTPFTTPHVIGSSVNVSCGDCDCAVGATCSGTLTVFADATCQTGGTTMSLDGVCRTLFGPFPTSASSYTYVADPLSCAATGSSMPAATLTNEATLCCTR